MLKWTLSEDKNADIFIDFWILLFEDFPCIQKKRKSFFLCKSPDKNE